MNKLAYRPAEAADISGISRTTLYKALATGELRSGKVGAARIILHDDLRAWLERFIAEGGV